MTEVCRLDAVGLDDVPAVARSGRQVEVGPVVLERVAEGRAVVERLAGSSDPVYGISTGFGALATVSIPPDRRTALQKSLIRSHAAGTGPLVDDEVVRAMMLLRLKTLASGLTGVRPVVVTTLQAMLNAGIVPTVHAYGSLGCSGDLAPLSHVALAAMGEGWVRSSTGVESAADALASAGITPLVLQEKEGLALINGTDGMLGMLILALSDLRSLLRISDLVTAMSVEALLGTDKVYSEQLHALRPHPGQAQSAANIRRLLTDSPIVASHRADTEHLVQDAYSLRCSPAVAGAARDTMDHARAVAERELASTIDNPVILPGDRVESNGNFHGAPIAYALDFLAIAAADVASISERRTDRMLDRSRSQGLPPFLAHETGVDSGYMIAQYAAAGIVSNLKRLATPASVDSIPSSAMQEDHVSMGWAAGLKLREAVDGLRRVLAIELLVASRALDLRAPLRAAAGTGAAVQTLREAGVPGPGPDVMVGDQIDRVVSLLESGAVLASVNAQIGDLD
ncbi:MAG: histidine ammonia-lyase [Actinobacteria bacterium]|nr:histidine ammonia-lyase [Micrococcales bacterium]MCB0903824.1 histidine ammonia-lyase [Actinomycetota bacterium]MCO5300919.1 histidine ammonia-lyase [Candidatus Nanopelagicales bacterium]MCB9428573.1 histidine ammonia-lyase [Actinomycetota bacterium]HPE12443.1 histidine ammonia-lyase [Actinomycetota bacterium]